MNFNIPQPLQAQVALTSDNMRLVSVGMVLELEANGYAAACPAISDLRYAG